MLTAIALALAGAALWLYLETFDRDPRRAHHGRWGYRNRYSHFERGLLAFLRWSWQRRAIEVERIRFPLAPNDARALRADRSASTLTWIGHSTFLLQIAGLNLLTDPHFSARASPVRWAGPERTTPPGLALAELPPIDAILISHNHYDHFDRPTLRALAGGAARGAAALVPRGLGRAVRRLGFARVVELDWWQSAGLAEAAFHAVPVQHFSSRTILDYKRTLWCGWAIEAAGRRILFAGDSGYSADFRDIRERLGAIDLALLPIGAYEPRWFMGAMHVDPEEAVRIHRDLAAGTSVAMHWGTFILTDEPQDEPPRRLARARAAAGIAPERFVVLAHGETRALAALLAPPAPPDA